MAIGGVSKTPTNLINDILQHKATLFSLFEVTFKAVVGIVSQSKRRSGRKEITQFVRALLPSFSFQSPHIETICWMV